MKFNLKEMAPWADIHSMLSNVQSMTVVADGKKYSGAAELTRDDEGSLTLTVGKAPAKEKAPASKAPAKKGKKK